MEWLGIIKGPID